MSLQSAIKRSSTRLKSSHIQSFSTCTSPLRAAHNFLSSTTRPTPIGDLDILLNDHDKNQRDSLPKTPERDDESFKLAHKLTDATFGKTTHKSSRSATSGNSTYGGGGSTFLEVERGITRTEKKLDFETTKQQSRNWREGDVFGPRDLGPGEMRKWKKSQRPTRDVFDILNVDPMDEYKNPVLLAEFMSPMGRIKHSRDTGLRPVNQRKVARAIRRAIGMNIIPSVHVHPEMLRREGYWRKQWY